MSEKTNKENLEEKVQEKQPATEEKAQGESASSSLKSEESPSKEASENKKETSAPEQEAGAQDKKEEASDKKQKSQESDSVELQGLFAFKLAMTHVYDETGRLIPVTVLKYKPWKVSQIKTQEKEGYSSIQLACGPQKNNRCSRAVVKHLEAAGFKEGARYIKEIRQDIPEGLKVGQVVSIDSLKKGDQVKISSYSKGRGFAGVVKRWGFHGGCSSHGSKAHRRPGSIGQHTEPARVMPGRKMPGHYGAAKTTFHSVSVVDILPEENMIFIKGPVPGARNSLVSLQKMESFNG